jgi:hypothetical protein
MFFLICMESLSAAAAMATSPMRERSPPPSARNLLTLSLRRRL